MKHTTGARVAAVAAGVIAAGIAVAGPADAATPQAANPTTVAPSCSASATRISADDLQAGIAKAATLETPGLPTSPVTKGFLSTDPVASAGTKVAPECSAAVRISSADLRAGIEKASSQEIPGAIHSTRTSGLVADHASATASPSNIAPMCSAAVRIPAADLKANVLKAASTVAPGSTGPILAGMVARPETAVAPACSAAARIPAAELQANVLKAATHDAPGVLLSTGPAGRSAA